MLLVVVASRRVLWPQHGVWSPQHSTAPLTFTSLLSLSLAAAGVGSPGPRLHAHHSAAPGAPWRREAHRRAVRSSRGAVCRHLHTTQPHTGTTLTTFTTFSLSLGAVHGGNTVDGSAPCWGRWTDPFPEYGQYGICSQLLERETCSGQSYICCNILNFIMSLLNESAAREAKKKFDN